VTLDGMCRYANRTANQRPTHVAPWRPRGWVAHNLPPLKTPPLPCCMQQQTYPPKSSVDQTLNCFNTTRRQTMWNVTKWIYVLRRWSALIQTCQWL